MPAFTVQYTNQFGRSVETDAGFTSRSVAQQHADSLNAAYAASASVIEYNDICREITTADGTYMVFSVWYFVANPLADTPTQRITSLAMVRPNGEIVRRQIVKDL